MAVGTNGPGRRPIVAVAACLAAVACTDATTGAEPRERIGALQLERRAQAGSPESVGDTAIRWSLPTDVDVVLTPPSVIDAPDTVRAGESFRVTVTTIGENGCWQPGRHELQVAGSRADIVPWDAHSGADACTEALAYLAHAVDVTFAERGTAEIRVTGMRRTRGGDSHLVTLTASRTVVVQ